MLDQKNDNITGVNNSTCLEEYGHEQMGPVDVAIMSAMAG